jgi:Tol biopolymer transport system component
MYEEEMQMSQRFLPSIIAGWMILLLILSVPPMAAAQATERCFDETGYCVSGRILAYWEQNGGLPVFGFPISPQREELVEGQPRQVQWFERNRLELHPENAPPYDVLLGRLGGELVATQDAPAPEAPQAGCRYSEQTGFNICGEILAYWNANGLEIDGQPGTTAAESIALFGLPLTGTYETTLPDGNVITVQWFERARFELHPQNAPPYNVLLGRLGVETLERRGEEPLPPPPAEPAPAGNADQIVFQINPEGYAGPSDIYTINPDGSDLTRLTTNGTSSVPTWSPDKRRIAYVSNGNIFVMNADGSSQTALTDTGRDANPAWSPDGSQIVFARSNTNAADIYLMNTDGSGITNLTNNPANDTAPTWMPDGRIVFSSDRIPPEGPVVAVFISDLFVMNRDGANVARLIDTRNAFGTAVAPDGSRLAFYSQGNDISSERLFVANADGSNVTEIERGFAPAWSPDSRRLAFALRTVDQRGILSTLHISNPDGSGLTEVHAGAHPDW